MTHLTDEELDRARAEEARRRDPISIGDVAFVAARLARTGWTPPPKVDPDVLEVRKLLAERSKGNGFDFIAHKLRSGAYDSDPVFQTTLAAIRRGREIERANPSNPGADGKGVGDG